MENSFSPVNVSPATFYHPSISAAPMFPYSSFFSGYVSQEMSSSFLGKDVRVLPGYVGPCIPCYHQSFQGIPYQPADEEKPTQSYIGLIGKAILSSPQQKLVLGDIYNYILTNYPYFGNKGPGWRNSIRHNLSLNDCFVKLGRSPNGKGHFWAINPLNYEDFSRGEYKRKRATRRNRERKESGGTKLNTTGHVPRCSSQEIRCTNKIFPDEAENRGFHIETLLSDKWEDVKSSETHEAVSAFSFVSQRQIPVKKELEVRRFHHRENDPAKQTSYEWVSMLKFEFKYLNVLRQ